MEGSDSSEGVSPRLLNLNCSHFVHTKGALVITIITMASGM